MKFGYTILYVPDVAASLAFFEKAFGLSRRFLAETGDYGELDTGSTTLSFASQELALSHHPAGYVFASASDKLRELRRRVNATSESQGGRPIDLEVDGGINHDTAATAIAAGADVLVAGTATFTGGPASYAANIARLRG